MINIAGCDHGSDAIPLTHVEVVMENIMPICIRHRDKNTAVVQQADIVWIIIAMKHFCMCLIRNLKDFRVLYGSI